jgi:hypothetical protein
MASTQEAFNSTMNHTYAKSPVPRQVPDFTAPVAAAEEEVRVLRARIETLADRLCGTVPETDSAGLNSVPSGVFEAIAEHGRSISRNVSEACEALDRIERSLP